ncbi:MAG: transcription antitermination protein transcriptional antiterminator NusG [Candidatus Parcubacteria bacterium]|jgi:transcriptional antiterminator NusG
MAKQELKARNWYTIQTYSGYENAVVRNLKQRIESLGLEDKIFNVMVPTERVIKIKNGKRVEEDVRIYPGYVLVDMIVTEETWFAVRNTPRVTGFVGAGTIPVPVSETELAEIFSRMKGSNIIHTLDVAAGDYINIVDGPFKDLDGKVAEIDQEKGKLRVLVSMFGRETPVELDFLQVKKK